MRSSTQACETPHFDTVPKTCRRYFFREAPSRLAHYRRGRSTLCSGKRDLQYRPFFNAMFLAEIRNIQECGCYTESSILNLQRDIWMPYKTLFIELLK